MKPLTAFFSWPAGVLAAAVLSLTSLVVKQHADNASLQQRVEALLVRQAHSQAADQAEQARLMAQIRKLDADLFNAHAVINQYQAASRIPSGDPLANFPRSIFDKPVRW